jgi:hypothetical protein
MIEQQSPLVQYVLDYVPKYPNSKKRFVSWQLTHLGLFCMGLKYLGFVASNLSSRDIHGSITEDWCDLLLLG